MDDAALVAVANLKNIAARLRGVPQIKVIFFIDANCVLTVSAIDQETEQEVSIVVTDVHLLAPKERDKIREKFSQTRDWERNVRELDTVYDSIRNTLDAVERLGFSLLVKHWRKLREDFRAPGMRLEASDEDALKDMFHNVEVDAHAQRLIAVWRDLSANAKNLMAKKPDGVGANVSGMIASARGLCRSLDDERRKIEKLTARIEAWNAILLRAKESTADAAGRIDIAHAKSDYKAVIVEFEKAQLEEIPDAVVERYLDSIGREKSRREYDKRLKALVNAGKVASWLRDAGPLHEWFERMRPRVAFIEIQLGGQRGSGSGFLVAADRVATNRHVVMHDGTAVHTSKLKVFVDGQWAGVRSIQLPDSADIDVAVLCLEKRVSASPFRLRPSGLVNVEQAYGMGFPTPEPDVPMEENFWGVAGYIQRIRRSNVPVPLFEIDHKLQPGVSGGPLVNILGEVCGLLTMARTQGERFEPAYFAVSVDPVVEILGPPWSRV